MPYFGFRTQDNVQSSKITLRFQVLFPNLILSLNNIQVNCLNIIISMIYDSGKPRNALHGWIRCTYTQIVRTSQCILTATFSKPFPIYQQHLGQDTSKMTSTSESLFPPDREPLCSQVAKWHLLSH